MSYYPSFVPTIVLRIEDKVNTNILVVFRILTNANVFVDIKLVLLIYFQFDTVSRFIITILLTCADSMINSIVSKDLITKFLFWGCSLASKFGLIL